MSERWTPWAIYKKENAMKTRPLTEIYAEAPEPKLGPLKVGDWIFCTLNDTLYRLCRLPRHPRDGANPIGFVHQYSKNNGMYAMIAQIKVTDEIANGKEAIGWPLLVDLLEGPGSIPDWLAISQADALELIAKSGAQ